MSFRPYENSELFTKFGFAVGNGLNTKSLFALIIWAVDLEDEVKYINGRNRDYLLTASGTVFPTQPDTHPMKKSKVGGKIINIKPLEFKECRLFTFMISPSKVLSIGLH